MSENGENDLLETNLIENSIDFLETAEDFFTKEKSLKWKWISIAIHQALYSFCIDALLYGNPDKVISQGQDDDKKMWCKIGSSEKWHKSIISKIHKGPAYRIKWEIAEDEPPRLKSDSKSKTNRQEKLIGFWTALARVQDNFFWMRRMDHTKALVLNDDEIKEIMWLVLKVRNEFLHFVPKFYIIDVESIKSACFIMTKAIRFLVFESGSIYIREEQLFKNTKKVVDSLLEKSSKE